MIFENSTYYIYLFGEVNFDSCKNIISEINKANIDSSKKQILLTICSGGGQLSPAFAVCDHLKLSKLPIIGLAEGWCGSAAIAILQNCNQRQATINTRFKLHSSSHKSDNIPYEELVRFAEQAQFQYEHFVNLTLERSGATRKEFEMSCIPVKYLGTEDALKFGKKGLIDEVIQ